MNSTYEVKSIAILGIGLIGSSLARALRAKYPQLKILGFDSNPTVRARSRELQLLDVQETVQAAVTDIDLVILCTPLSTFSTLANEIKENLKKNCIVSDVGSAKKPVLDMLLPILPEYVHLLPAHPVAGTEKSGPDAGFSELFQNRWCILTPPARHSKEALETLAQLWTSIGARVEIMDAQHHDLVLAATSHIPHLIAYSMVGTASDLEGVTQSEVIKYSAGGFRDFTRIAASDPTMWRDVFLMNKEAVLEVLGRFSEDLAALQRAIRWNDGELLYKRFSQSRDIRQAIIQAGQDTSTTNFGRKN